MRLFVLWTCLGVGGFAAAAEPGDVVIVDGQPITQRDVRFLAELRGQPLVEGQPVPERIVDEAIDRALIRKFLAAKKIAPQPEFLAQQLQQVEGLIRKRQEEPEAFLKRLGYTQEQWEQELALPLAWAEYVQQVTPGEQIAAEFQAHRSELDGTRIRARHIILKLPADPTPAQIQVLKDKLAGLRTEILAGRREFAAVAKEISESPSRETGGELGVIPFRGRIPAPVAAAAFKLKSGEMTEPVVSPFGVHLILVEERIPGQLSLEDARPQILEALGRDLWQRTAGELRARAKIGRPKS